MNFLEYQAHLRSMSERLRSGEITSATAADLIEVLSNIEVEGYPDPLPSRENVGPVRPRCSRCRNAMPSRDFDKLVCGNGHDGCFSMDADVVDTCPGFSSRYIEYPIQVNAVNTRSTAGLYCIDSGKMQFVRVRPCGEKYGGRTYLGVFLGDMVNDVNVYFRGQTKEIDVLLCTNPAMYVPELGEVIWGRGSFWSKIECEADFRDITDEEQNNVFYMRWLRNLSERQNPNGAGET